MESVGYIYLTRIKVLQTVNDVSKKSLPSDPKKQKTKKKER